MFCGVSKKKIVTGVVIKGVVVGGYNIWYHSHYAISCILHTYIMLAVTGAVKPHSVNPKTIRFCLTHIYYFIYVGVSLGGGRRHKCCFLLLYVTHTH